MVEYSKARLGADGKIEVYDTKTINPSRCPHFIMVGEHYRDDGSCRCNDQSHMAMKDWGYVWNTKGFWEAGPEEEDEGEHEWSAQSEKPLDTPSLDTSFHDHEMDTDE